MNKVESALQRTTDTKALVIGVGTLPRTAEMFNELFPGCRAVVVADTNTWRVAGGEVHRILADAGIGQDEPHVFADPKLYAEWSFVDGASITKDGNKQTFDGPAPLGMVLDPSSSAAAPARMSASGYADLIAKIPAGADWMLSDAVGSEPMDDFAFGLVQDGLKEALSDPAGVHAGNVEKVEQLAEGLLLSGFAMQATQSSRQASGAEHQFSHLWHMEHLKYNGASVSHGFKVGIGTLASTAFLEMLLDAPVEQLDIERCVAAWKSWDETERDIRAIFNDDPEFVARGLKETRDKYVDREGLRDQLTRLKKAWPELRERIRRQISPFDEVRRRLELVGAPYEPEQIGASRTRFREAFGKIPDMRSRYTVIDTAFRCGWMEEWLDRLFGKGGVWEVGSPAPGSGEPARSAAAPVPGA